MALNLVRNSKVFFTTNVDATTGILPYGGFGVKNTYELQVLDGFSFSQNTNAETVTLNESGSSPVRGQRSFNTSLAPVDFSFSTYIRPKNTGTIIAAEENLLWNALFSSKALINTADVIIGTGGTGSISGVTYTGATGTITISGTSLPTASLLVNDEVIINGLTATAGMVSERVNGYGTVATSSATSITIVLNSFSNTATTITTPTTLTVRRIREFTNATKIGTGGTGTFTSVTYAFSAGVGTLSLVGGASLPTFTVGDVVVVSNITGTITGTVTLAQLNQPAVVKTSSATALTLELSNPPTGTLTSVSPSVTALTITKSAWAENGTAFSLVSTASSDINQLQKFGMLFLVDNIMYGIDNCALNEASIDFSIDGIATIAWTGQGTSLRRMTNSATPNTATATAASGLFGGTMVYGAYDQKDTSANYITNRLSNIVLTSQNIVKDSVGTTVMAKGDDYTLAITGGNISINNNITYLTPELLGTVNIPTTYFQGTRAITGNITAYLKTGGTRDTGELLTDLLSGSATNTEIMMSTLVNIGGTSGPRISLDMPSTVLTIPTVDVQQVVSTSINFTAEGSAPDTVSSFDLTKENDLTIRYYS